RLFIVSEPTLLMRPDTAPLARRYWGSSAKPATSGVEWLAALVDSASADCASLESALSAVCAPTAFNSARPAAVGTSDARLPSAGPQPAIHADARRSTINAPRRPKIHIPCPLRPDSSCVPSI